MPAEPYSTLVAARGVSASLSDPTSLRRSADFRRVLSGGRRIRQGPLTVIAAPGEPGAVRVGMVVGKRVGGAVDRNRVKRRLRHAVARISMEPSMDYVIIAERSVLDSRFEDLKAWLESAVERAAP